MRRAIRSELRQCSGLHNDLQRDTSRDSRRHKQLNSRFQLLHGTYPFRGISKVSSIELEFAGFIQVEIEQR